MGLRLCAPPFELAALAERQSAFGSEGKNNAHTNNNNNNNQEHEEPQLLFSSYFQSLSSVAGEQIDSFSPQVLKILNTETGSATKSTRVQTVARPASKA